MTHTFDELKKMTVAELREIAAGIQHEAVQGYTQLNKEHLLAVLCRALDIDTHTRHKIKAPGIDKAGVKSQMKALKKKRDAALGVNNHSELKAVRRQLHSLRRSLRRAATRARKGTG